MGIQDAVIQIFAKRKRLLYSLVFNNTEGRKVLEDLSSFGYVDQSTFDPNPIVQARNEGRRQVILYILQALHMNINDIGEQPNGTNEYPNHASDGPVSDT